MMTTDILTPAWDDQDPDGRGQRIGRRDRTRCRGPTLPRTPTELCDKPFSDEVRFGGVMQLVWFGHAHPRLVRNSTLRKYRTADTVTRRGVCFPLKDF